MTAGGVPIIPGSEIRGMIRNIYETITNSCFSVINCNTLSQRDGRQLKYAGLLRWNDQIKHWQLYKAEHISKFKSTIDQEKKKLVKEKAEFVERKWLVFPSPEKNNNIKEIDTTLFKKIGRESITVSGNQLQQLDDQVKTLNEILNLYEQYDKNHKYEALFEAVRPPMDDDKKNNNKYYPVFYDLSDNGKFVTRLAPAQISRAIFDHTVEDLLEKTGHAPCKKTSNLCPACRLLGSVMQDGAVSSRLRFSDAAGEDITLSPAIMDKEEDVTTLKELSSPKLTSIEFYSLLENDTQFSKHSKWDYDDDDKGVFLRGRKIYLHNPKAELKEGENPKYAVYSIEDMNDKELNAKKGIKDVRKELTTNRNSSMQLATKGRFGFSVYFNGITENELKTLVWALTLGDADGTTSRLHKLGHGRPLGLGSVKLTVDSIAKRTTDGTAYHVETEEVEADYFNGFHLPVEGTDTLTALLTVSDFNYTGEYNVAYPIGTAGVSQKNDHNSMQWFSINHGRIGKNRIFKHVLHPIVLGGRAVTADKLLLPHLYKEGVNPSGGQTYSTGSFGGNRGNSGNTRGNTSKQLALNDEVEAKITGSHSSKSGKLYIDFNASGHKGNLPAHLLPKDIPIGTVIKVRYKGKNGNGFDTYELVK